MRNRIAHFLTASLITVSIFCVIVFAALGLYLNKKNSATINQVGTIYMASMNERISKHFETMTDLRLAQIRTLAETIPAAKRNDAAALKTWLTESAQARGFDSLSYYYEDGSMEVLYGGGGQFLDSEPFAASLKEGEDKVYVGRNPAGDLVVLMGVPFRMELPNGRICAALVGELPVSYISDTLSLEDEDSLVYSFVIRKDGSFVIRSFDAFRNSYFERVLAIYEELDGKEPEDYLAEIKAAIASGEDYSTIFRMYGDRRHLYCSSLPNSEWYLVTVMPYGVLNEAVEDMGVQSLAAAMCCCAAILLVLLAVFLKYFRMNREQMTELEEARREAEEASRSKSEFLSNMSHDIRTPMNAIVGMTAIASANINDSQQVQNCLKKITLSSKHLLGLINDVLDMSKIESGKMTLNTELISLREIMDSIVSIVQPQVKAKNQRFNVFIYDISSENVRGDSVRLNQIMLNLLSNAIKFTPEGGSIELALHEEKSPKGDDRVRIRIRVKDTGIGMSEEFRKHIFESFTREDSKRVHKIEGTGLGMAITKYIVDAMGGEITVASQQGKGTEFQVVLDLERAEEREEDMILPDWTMLVVDDDQQLCESTVASLKSIGIRAEWTLDGESAVKMVTQHHKIHNDYHVILLDWKLPGMDGVKTARELRRQLGDDVPILLMSAYDWSEIEEEARDAGISGFLAKPLFRSTLFYGLLPYTGGEEETEREKKPAADLSGRRLLVAEDNELNWEISRELLGSMGLELEWAENGQICLDMFQQSPSGYYDAILMDIRMPVMNGYEAADAIRALDRPDAGLPIVAMTADAFSEDIQRCLEHGMNAHVAKPVDIKELAAVLERYL
ncbi:hybrid sensor histidine kinase/response regulator [uncultured Dysosmobacter sp.]|uniref:hybrid sensor histidine kinase/response regulator n=1 Tax=uncultured Dysosmobacter sp. TaxID=2591384 RepID=UPI0026079BA2|nr:hybrid sensor histidine kinase/response regulator [uncultured Dysosmobacter sp.]